MSVRNNPEYLESLQIFYSERLKSGLKKKFKVCKGCSEPKQFIVRDGVLYYTCGSSSGKCGLQMEIKLSKYAYYPESLETHTLVSNQIDKSKHSDIYSPDEIKEYQEFLKTSEDILRESKKDYFKLNKINERQAMIQKIHKNRITHKKEQNLLLTSIQDETDVMKKQGLIKDYINLNQVLFEDYNKLNEMCETIDNFLLLESGSVNKESSTFQAQPKKEQKERLGKVIDKNLIPQLQGLVKQPNNNMIMNVIVAYRDPGDGTRKEQLKQFKEQMNLIFKDQTDIQIYIIEQEGDRDDYGSLPELIQQPNSQMAKFNLGILKNIGFHEASKLSKNKKNAYYILSDVDMLPSQELIKDYLKYPKQPIHLANKGTRYNMDGRDQNFLGGVLSVNKQDFIKSNGYPNNFWGWGGEDNSLNYRFKKSNIPIDKSSEPVIDLEGISLRDKLTKLKQDQTKEMRKREKLEQDKTSWKENGLSDLEGKYKIVKKLKVKNIRHYKVHLKV